MTPVPRLQFKRRVCANGCIFWQPPVRWPTTVTAKSNSEQENKIQKNKLKLLPANYKHLRQKQKQVTLSRIRHNKSKLLTAKTNCLRQKQIAHGKSQNGGQRFLVSGCRSTWCNTTWTFAHFLRKRSHHVLLKMRM